MSDEARTSGRGVALMTGAKAFFVVGGLAVQLGLPRLLRSPEEYGLYATVTALLAILTNTLTQAAVQTASKHVSETTDPRAALRHSLGLALSVGGVVALALFALAEPLATLVLHDARVAPLLRIASVIVVAYSVYATAIGHLNGQRDFARQARLDLSFTLVRTTGLLVGGALSIGALGAMLGFSGAAVTMALVALVFVGVGAGGTRPATVAWLAFFGAIALHQLALNGLLQLDVEILKARVASLALAAGSGAEEAASRASTEAGLYRAAQSIAFVPYQLILAVTLVLFPTVARARSAGDAEAATRAVRGALRFSLVALVLTAAPVAGAGEGAMRVLFDARYAPGGDALAVLALGQIAFTLFVVGSTAISGDGAPILVALSAALGVAVTVAVAALGIEAAGLDGPLRMAAAAGAASGCLLAVVLVLALVARRFSSAAIPWLSLARGAVAGTAGFAVAHAMPHGSRMEGLAALVLGGLASLAVLALSRELGADDVALVRRVLRR